MVKGMKKAESNAGLGVEAKLWLSADKLRNKLDAAEYKHVVLGLANGSMSSSQSGEGDNRPAPHFATYAN